MDFTVYYQVLLFNELSLLCGVSQFRLHGFSRSSVFGISLLGVFLFGISLFGIASRLPLFRYFPVVTVLAASVLNCRQSGMADPVRMFLMRIFCPCFQLSADFGYRAAVSAMSGTGPFPAFISRTPVFALVMPSLVSNCGHSDGITNSLSGSLFIHRNAAVNGVIDMICFQWQHPLFLRSRCFCSRIFFSSVLSLEYGYIIPQTS